MLRETAEILRLTPYINEFSAPPCYIGPSFYYGLEHENDPPIYAAVLESFRVANEAFRKDPPRDHTMPRNETP